ncbi:MAG: DUF3244 domain-containing protein [Bacteroidota bacterium]
MNKVLFKTATVVAALFIAFNASAAVENPFSLYVSKAGEAKKIVLRLDNMFADKVTCKIYTESGAVIFSDEIYTANKTAKKYDLSQLPQGEYTILINDLMKVEQLDLVVTENSVDFVNPVADITFKPTVWVNEDKTVDFNLLSLGNNVNVSIYNETSEEVYSKSYIGKTTVSKRFNMADLPAGEYTIAVTNGGEVFYNYVTI